MGTSFSIGDIINQSWAIVKKYFVVFLGAMVIYSIISTLLSLSTSGFGHFPYTATNPEDLSEILSVLFSPILIISSLISLILSYYFNLCWYNMGLMAAKGEEPSFSCFLIPLNKILYSIVANFIYSIIVAIGLIFCIVPGIILAIRFQFFNLNILDKNMGIFESLSASWNQTKGYTMDLFLLGLMYIFINILGFLCCCVGLLVTIPMTIIGLSVAYLTLDKKNSGETPEDSNPIPPAPTRTPSPESAYQRPEAPVVEKKVEEPIAEVKAETPVSEPAAEASPEQSVQEVEKDQPSAEDDPEKQVPGNA